MKKLMLFLVISSAFCVQFSESVNPKKHEKIVGCYFNSMVATFRQSRGKFEISNIDASLCTHVVYSFKGQLKQGPNRVSNTHLSSQNIGFELFEEFRKHNPSVITLFSMSGWTRGCLNSSNMSCRAISDPTLRRNLVTTIVELVAKNGFHGFDLDWEYPDDKKDFVVLLEDLRQEFDKHGFILCVSVGATQETARMSYDIKIISKNAHIINLMAYDFHTPFHNKPKIIGHNAPLFPSARESAHDKTLNVASAVKFWIEAGAPPGKILLGTAMFGKSYTLLNPKEIGRGAPFIGPGNAGKYTHEYGTLGYNEICDLIKIEKWQVFYDREQQVPYAHKGNELVAYDNVESLTRKAEFINEMNLGGTMAWSIDTDDFNGDCGERYPLLKALNRVLRNINYPSGESHPGQHWRRFGKNIAEPSHRYHG